MGRLDRASARRVPKNQIDPRMVEARSKAQSEPKLPIETLIPTQNGVLNRTGRTTVALGKVDFSGVQDFKPVPADSYESVFTSWEEKQNSPDGDNPNGTHVLAQFTIADGGEYDGKKLRVRWALTDKALWRIRQDLITLGADPEDLAGDDVDLGAVIAAQVGKRVILDVKVSEYTPRGGGEKRQTNEVTGMHEATVGAASR